jgi:hypothetical protein
MTAFSLFFRNFAVGERIGSEQKKAETTFAGLQLFIAITRNLLTKKPESTI